MSACLLDQHGESTRHRHLHANPETFLQAIAPYRDALGVAVECLVTWSWLADLCAREGLPCGRGHALSMTAIHGGKAKHDTTVFAHTRARVVSDRLTHATVFELDICLNGSGHRAGEPAASLDTPGISLHNRPWTRDNARHPGTRSRPVALFPAPARLLGHPRAPGQTPIGGPA
jgi:hypothetical protein